MWKIACVYTYVWFSRFKWSEWLTCEMCFMWYDWFIFGKAVYFYLCDVTPPTLLLIFCLLHLVFFFFFFFFFCDVTDSTCVVMVLILIHNCVFSDFSDYLVEFYILNLFYLFIKYSEIKCSCQWADPVDARLPESLSTGVLLRQTVFDKHLLLERVRRRLILEFTTHTSCMCLL